MKKEMICIICPLGCHLTVESDNSDRIGVKGNGCKRGEHYAKEEFLCPKRTLTTTVLSVSGKTVSCKTLTPIPKEKLLEAMKIINSVKIDLPISVGDVIIEDVFGAKVVATENVN